MAADSVEGTAFARRTSFMTRTRALVLSAVLTAFAAAAPAAAGTSASSAPKVPAPTAPSATCCVEKGPVVVGGIEVFPGGVYCFPCP